MVTESYYWIVGIGLIIILGLCITVCGLQEKMYRPLFTVKDIKQGEEITCSYTLYDLEAD